MLVGANVWAQDAVFDMGKMAAEFTSADGKETLTFAGGDPEDVHEAEGVTDLSGAASMTLSGVNVRYIRITFADAATTYNLKWGGNNNANNSVNAKGSIILVSNYGSDNIKVVNDTEKGTTNTPIKKVEVFYHQLGFDTATADHTEANATKKVENFTCLNNTISLEDINIVGQYCSLSPANGHGIMMNTSGDHYLSIKFASAVNLKDLSSFVVDGTNVDKNNGGVFNRAKFFCNGGDFDKYNNPSNITSFDDAQKTKLEACTEIRLYNDEKEGTFTIKSIVLNFNDSHKKLTTPVLNNGTSAYMEKDINEPFTLSATNGYWREYKSDLTGEKSGGLISGVWASTHPFENGLPAGDYYFGIQDNENKNCVFGINHHSDLVTVHVRVANLQPTLTCENNSVDLKHITTFGNITSNLADGKITGTISHNDGEYGNGFSLEFTEAQNFSQVSAITIRTDFDFSTGCDVYLEDAEEMNAEGTSKKAYWPWGNTYSNGTFTLHLDKDVKFSNIKKLVLRPHFNTGDFEISSITVDYDHSLTTPQLVDGTEPNIVLTEGDDLILSADNVGNTYWREYKDANYNWYDQISKHIPTTEYNTPVRTIKNLPPGTYYFAAERGAGCEFGKWHTSDKATVVVVVKELSNDTDFAGYYRFDNRLSTQWNFDQCDGYRFNEKNIDSNVWSKQTSGGNVIYTNKIAFGNQNNPDYTKTSNFAELTYDGAAGHKIAITSGLLFNAPAGSVQFIVSYDNSNGVKVQKGARLHVTPDVRLLIPYVENTYRNDLGGDKQPDEPRDSLENIISTNRGEYKNSPHHWKRDILYVSLTEGNVWDVWRWDTHVTVPGHILNKCIDDNTKDLFNSGGEENVNGVKWYKMNYMGNHGTPCVIQFQRETTFNRLAVNRNLTYSFYSEYISDFGETYQQPRSRIRVIGSPAGALVANIGPFLNYNGAIAFTYGGWLTEESSDVDIDSVKNDLNDYYQYKADNSGNAVRVTDKWSELGVFTGQNSGAEAFKKWTDAPTDIVQDINAPIAPDGFPVLSVLNNPAKSGSLTFEGDPAEEELSSHGKTLPNYHPRSNGNFFGGNSYPYKENITPWSLPTRGAYLKFEPSYPGVLNVDFLQLPNAVYHIVDEFGIPYSDPVFIKNATVGKSVVDAPATNDRAKGYKLDCDKADYVKYSFNVYPGKTYYLFSNEAGLGFAGFYFEPYVNRYDSKAEYAQDKNVQESSVSDTDIEYARKDVGVYEISLDKNTDYSYPTFPNPIKSVDNLVEDSLSVYSKAAEWDETKEIKTVYSPIHGSTDGSIAYTPFKIHYSKRAVKVNLNRSFKKDTWNTICLPFSMNQVQMENIFGKGTRVILLRDLQNADRNEDDKRTLSLICHENQDIIAGYPYFILPKADVSNVETYACFDKFPETVNNEGKIPTNPKISSVGPNTNVWDMSLKGEDTYTMMGTFSHATVKKGSLYVNAKTGKLMKLNSDDATLDPYRAWFQLTGENSNEAWTKKLDAVVGIDADFEDDATGIDIDELLSEQGIFTNASDVYSVNGQLVRKNALNLNDLPKGIYVVNGKKYIVK